MLLITNSATAGIVTFSGYSKVTGDSLTTTNGHKHLLFITKLNGVIHAHNQAMQ